MSKTVNSDEVMYHIGLSKNMIEGAEYVFLPGDPGRVESLAKGFDKNAKQLNFHREYNSYLCDFYGQKVLVCSTGMGGPSVGIGVEELATIGLKYLVRVGTTGAIQENIALGDIIVTAGAVRLDGTSTHYAPIEFPAIPSLKLTNSLMEASENVSKVAYHSGITVTSDTFWPGQERNDNYSQYVPRKFRGSLEEWRALGATNFEMEAASLFIMATAFRLESAAICGVIAKRTDSEVVRPESFDMSNMQNVLRDFLRVDMKKRGLI